MLGSEESTHAKDSVIKMMNFSDLIVSLKFCQSEQMKNWRKSDTHVVFILFSPFQGCIIGPDP